MKNEHNLNDVFARLWPEGDFSLRREITVHIFWHDPEEDSDDFSGGDMGHVTLHVRDQEYRQVSLRSRVDTKFRKVR